MEGILDHIFVKFGIDGEDGGVGRPVLMTEPLANLGYTRKCGYPRQSSVCGIAN